MSYQRRSLDSSSYFVTLNLSWIKIKLIKLINLVSSLSMIHLFRTDVILSKENVLSLIKINNSLLVFSTVFIESQSSVWTSFISIDRLILNALLRERAVNWRTERRKLRFCGETRLLAHRLQTINRKLEAKRKSWRERKWERHDRCNKAHRYAAAAHDRVWASTTLGQLVTWI